MNEPSPAPAPARDSSLRIWTAVLIIASLTLAYLLLRPPLASNDRGPDYPGVGVELSTLQFEPLTGDPPPVEKDDLRGKVAVINFWGPWCHFCRKEMPHLLDMEKRFREHDDFRMLLVSNNGQYGDVEELRESTAEYLSAFESPPPTYRDPNFRSLTALASEAQLPRIGFPITAVLDRQGTLRGLWLGFLPEDAPAMEQLVEKLLAGL
jgi:thiol-disulfide isomerase/thioredoxin